MTLLYFTNLSRYERPRNAAVLCKYVTNAKAIPHIGWRKAPKLYKAFAPIFAPYIPNKGAERNAARLAIPKTKPYYQWKNQYIKRNTLRDCE